MFVRTPLKRRQKKAGRYLDALVGRVYAQPKYGIRNLDQAEYYASALILVALFSDQERELFTQLYQAYTEEKNGSCLAEVRDSCAKQHKQALCSILGDILSSDRAERMITEFMMRIIKEEQWISIQEELRESRLGVDDFTELRTVA